MSRRGKWRYTLWCTVCYGVDPEGCLGGKTKLSVERYDTSEQADAALCKELDSYNPFCDVTGRVVHVSEYEREYERRG